LSNCAFLGRLLFLQKTSCRWQGHLHVQVGATSSFLAQASFFADAEVALLEEEEMVMEDVGVTAAAVKRVSPVS
jgi:hypothetical protein